VATLESPNIYVKSSKSVDSGISFAIRYKVLFLLSHIGLNKFIVYWEKYLSVVSTLMLKKFHIYMYIYIYDYLCKSV
jgi:hypothetical protein